MPDVSSYKALFAVLNVSVRDFLRMFMSSLDVYLFSSVEGCGVGVGVPLE